MLTGAEAGAVAKASGMVMQGLKGQMKHESSWPNMHAALMELHQILDDWCVAAAHTAEFARALLLEENYENESLTNLAGVGRWDRWRGSYLGRVERDIESVISPKGPLLQRWSGARRRRAARKTLRSMMQIYCPDLLASFESAAKDRACWVLQYREILKRGIPGISLADANHMTEEMVSTQLALNEARRHLEDLILAHFPMGGHSSDRDA
ncbi:hypothetical protein ACIOKD_36405 [Streptomyces sp. NPDC087844]|uniref:hypothetical protein n=1 Tax=Streptomyces sp. NPDC087844 TaxID=3365805 RepID=UPI00382FF873